MSEVRHSITGNGIHYWSYHDETSPTILLIHGFRGTHHGLEKIVSALPEFHCIVPDLPGFGQSKPFTNGEHSLDQYVEFLHEFQSDVAPAPVVLGHSFGTIIASHYAARYPSDAQRLILVNPISAPALKGPKAAMTKAALFYYWLAKKSPRRLSHAILSHPSIVDIMSRQMTVSKDPELRAFIKAQHRQHFSTFASPDVVSQAFKASVSHTVADVTKKLTMPTLVLGAENDQVSAAHTQQQFAKSLPKGTYVELFDVGHLTHYEKPTEVAGAIREFLNRQD